MNGYYLVSSLEIKHHEKTNSDFLGNTAIRFFVCPTGA
jgi:hypothetical protein